MHNKKPNDDEWISLAREFVMVAQKVSSMIINVKKIYGEDHEILKKCEKIKLSEYANNLNKLFLLSLEENKKAFPNYCIDIEKLFLNEKEGEKEGEKESNNMCLYSYVKKMPQPVIENSRMLSEEQIDYFFDSFNEMRDFVEKILLFVKEYENFFSQNDRKEIAETVKKMSKKIRLDTSGFLMLL
jgi:hypothetical protein